MRFLADMGISPHTVAFLRAGGHDAVHLAEQGLQRMEDGEIIRKARNERRVLLTHDLDFADLMASSGDVLPSVVIFRLRRMRPEIVNQHLQGIINQYGSVLGEGAIISVTDRQARLRLLPLEKGEA